MHIQFVLISEGASDNGLISHLEAICIHVGADEVSGIAIDPQRLSSSVGKKVSDKILAAIELEPQANLFLIHRDADSTDPEPRHKEIWNAASECNLQKKWVAIVPIQETEAWLLLDEAAIRHVANRPSGKQFLDLPSAQKVEAVVNPKERLKVAIITAGDVKGRRLERLKRDFSAQRQSLLQGLSINGKQRDVPSWQRMVNDIKTVIEALAGQEATERNDSQK